MCLEQQLYVGQASRTVTLSLVLNTETRSLFESTHESKMNTSLIIFPVQGSQAIQFSNTPPPPNNVYVHGGAFGGPGTLGVGVPWPNTGTQLISLSGAPPPQISLYRNKSDRFSSTCHCVLLISQFVRNQDGQQVTSDTPNITTRLIFKNCSFFSPQLLLPCPQMYHFEGFSCLFFPATYHFLSKL